MYFGNGEVKSSAVVKYSAAPPSTYALPEEKTDLKMPPANWLRENPQLGSAVLGSSSKSKPFSRSVSYCLKIRSQMNLRFCDYDTLGGPDYNKLDKYQNILCICLILIYKDLLFFPF